MGAEGSEGFVQERRCAAEPAEQDLLSPEVQGVQRVQKVQKVLFKRRDALLNLLNRTSCTY